MAGTATQTAGCPADRSSDKDRQFGRLLSYPSKIEIAYPGQDDMTAVVLVMGQSNRGQLSGPAVYVFGVFELSGPRASSPVKFSVVST
jgi:hypothetical protein